MRIGLVTTDEQIHDCYAVMRELRPHIEQHDFVTHVRRLAHSGYRMVAAWGPEGPVAVAGFRVGESLAWGRYLYVDDLVTLPSQRSLGHGSALLEWLRQQGIALGCNALHLDSGRSREAAHRFYEREGLTKLAYHFVQDLQ